MRQVPYFRARLLTSAPRSPRNARCTGRAPQLHELASKKLCFRGLAQMNDMTDISELIAFIDPDPQIHFHMTFEPCRNRRNRLFILVPLYIYCAWNRELVKSTAH